MRELHTEIEINASAERVWQLLTDFRRFPEWNPFMPRVKGHLAANETLEVDLTLPNKFNMTIKPTLIKVEPNRELRWLGHLIMPGIFDGEHIFTIERLSSDRVRLIHREEFRGWLVPLMLALVGKNTKRGFETMNQALKTQAEQHA